MSMRLWNRPGFLVRRLHQIGVAIFHDEMGGLAITPVQYGALLAVRAKPGIDQSRLATEIGIDKANAGGVVARMCAGGYLERRPSATDRRASHLVLTDEGRRLLDQANGRADEVQDRLLEPLAPAEREVLVELLLKLVEGHLAGEGNGKRNARSAVEG